MEFKEYLAIIRRRWLLFFPIFVLIVGAHLVWVAYSQQSRFTATTKIIIGESQSAGSGVSQGPFESLSASTLEQTLTDRPVLEKAAELALGQLEFQSPEFKAGDFPQRISAAQEVLKDKFAGENPVANLVAYMRTHVLHGGSRGGITDVSGMGETEEIALMLSWAVSEGASQFHADKIKEHLHGHLGSLHSRIQNAEIDISTKLDALNDVKQRTGIDDLSQKENILQSSLQAYSEKETEINAAIRNNERHIKNRLRDGDFTQRSDIRLSSNISSPELETIRRELFQTRLKYETRRTVLSEMHPEMMQMRARVGGLENAMSEERHRLVKVHFQGITNKTQELINVNAKLRIQKDVYLEQQDQMQRDLRGLQALRKEFAPLQTAYANAQEKLVALNSQLKEVEWQSDSQLGSVIVYDPGISGVPVVLHGGGFGPLTLTMLMAFIFALGTVYIVEYVDTRVKNEHDIRRHLNLPLLGTIPKESSRDCLLTDAPLQSEISEKFNTAATLLQSISIDVGIRAIMVCSAIAREGKTTVSINLAIALARKGAKVVLIDGDLRISQIHNQMQLPNHVGLSTALDNRVDAQQVIEGVMTDQELEGRQSDPARFTQQTSVKNLDVMSSGPSVVDPVTLLDPTRLTKLVSELKQTYDFVIFDTPPINKVGDALTISSAVDGSVFVVGAGQAEQHEVTWAKHLLTNVQSNILGVFLNKFSKQKGGEYYYYYYYNDKKRKRVKSRA